MRRVDLGAPHFAFLGNARALIADTLAAAFTVPPDIKVSAWAEDKREVAAESGSRTPGKWRNANTPYGVEPMDCLSVYDPCSDVTLLFGSQIMKTEIGVNFVGCTIDADPSPVLIVLPSIDEAAKFNRTKLGPAIEATPALRHKVREVKSRDEKGSTASYKRFRGGFIQITHAGSSKGLQAITVKKLWGDEISEFPLDAGGRGDPIDQMKQRNSTYVSRGAKNLWTSTPKLKGKCRISALYELSDQRHWYWKCPECGDYFTFRFGHLKWDSETPPHGAHCVTPCCGSIVPHWRKREMNASGLWLKTFPVAAIADENYEGVPTDVVLAQDLEKFRERKAFGRQPGFHLWRGQSAFHDWEMIVSAYLEAKDIPDKLKTFTQQVLAEAFEEAGEAPDHLRLYARREEREEGVLPDGVLALTGFADVQRNPPRLEWGVYGWGLKFDSWLIEHGVIPGDPESDETWAKLAAVVTKAYQDLHGRSWPIEAFGVDSGYASHAVYNFARRRPNVFATDGRGGATRPFIGTPKPVDVNWRGQKVKRGCMLWPLGTHPLKSALYAALQLTIQGPDPVSGLWPAGSVRFPRTCDESFFQQITAEFLKTVETRDGTGASRWEKRPGQANEQLDIWVGARAMASHIGLDRYTPGKWAQRVALHAAPDEGGEDDLLAFATRSEGKAPPEETAAPKSKQPAPAPKRKPRIVPSPFMNKG
jgi:phage terminase large subunit GpA-like protein